MRMILFVVVFLFVLLVLNFHGQSFLGSVALIKNALRKFEGTI